MCLPYGAIILSALYGVFAYGVLTNTPPCLEETCLSEGVNDTTINWASDFFFAACTGVLALHLLTCYRFFCRGFIAMLLLSIGSVLRGVEHAFYGNSGWGDGKGLREYYILTAISYFFLTNATAEFAFLARLASTRESADHIRVRSPRFCGNCELRIFQLCLSLAFVGIFIGSAWCAFFDAGEVLVDENIDSFPNDAKNLQEHMCVQVVFFGEGLWWSSSVLFWISAASVLGTAAVTLGVTWVCGLPNSLAGASIIALQVSAGAIWSLLLRFGEDAGEHFVTFSTVASHYTMLMTAFFAHNLIATLTSPLAKEEEEEYDVRNIEEGLRYPSVQRPVTSIASVETQWTQSNKKTTVLVTPSYPPPSTKEIEKLSKLIPAAAEIDFIMGKPSSDGYQEKTETQIMKLHQREASLKADNKAQIAIIEGDEESVDVLIEQARGLTNELVDRRESERNNMQSELIRAKAEPEGTLFGENTAAKVKSDLDIESEERKWLSTEQCFSINDKKETNKIQPNANYSRNDPQNQYDPENAFGEDCPKTKMLPTCEGPTPTWVYETGHMYEKEPAKAARMEKSTLGIDQSDKRGTPQTPLQQTQTATKQEPQESITPILYWVRHKISPLNKDTNPAESAWERLSSLMSGPTSIVSSDDSKVEEVVHTESFVGAKKMETEHKSEIHQRTPTLWWNRNEIVPRQDGNMQRAKGAWEQLSSLVSGPTTVHDGNQEETETEETVHQVTSWRKISSLISGPATVLNNDDDDYDNDDVEEGRDVLSSVTDCFDSLPVREY